MKHVYELYKDDAFAILCGVIGFISFTNGALTENVMYTIVGMINLMVMFNALQFMSYKRMRDVIIKDIEGNAEIFKLLTTLVEFHLECDLTDEERKKLKSLL